MKEQKQKPDIKKRTVNSPKNTTQLFRIKDNREETKKIAATIQMVNDFMQKSATVIQRGGGCSKCSSNVEEKQEINILSPNYILSITSIEDLNNVVHFAERSNTIIEGNLKNTIIHQLFTVLENKSIDECLKILTAKSYHTFIKENIFNSRKDILIKYYSDLIVNKMKNRIPNIGTINNEFINDLSKKIFKQLNKINLNTKDTEFFVKESEDFFSKCSGIDFNEHPEYYYLMVNNRERDKYFENPFDKNENLNKLINLSIDFHKLIDISKDATYQKEIGDFNNLTENEQSLLLGQVHQNRKLHHNYLHFTINDKVQKTNRIVVNIEPDNLNETVTKLYEKISKDPEKKGYKTFISEFKVSTPYVTGLKTDNIIIYYNANNCENTTKIKKLIEDIPGIQFRDNLPRFIKRLDKSDIGYAKELENVSFADKRAALANIAHNIGSTPEESTSILSALFKMSGIDPKEPWNDSNDYESMILKQIVDCLCE
jgi:hypothetical protein